MEKELVLFELRELKSHLETLIEEIAANDNEDSGLSTELAHLMDHIVLCWHYRNSTWDEINAHTQEEFEKLIRSIPRFHDAYRLVDLEGE